MIKSRTTAVITILFLVMSVISIQVQAAQVYRVKEGDDLFTIAQNYGITTQEIINENHLKSPDNIFATQVLIIPDVNPSYLYRVKKGDTLYKISQNLRIPLNVLAKANYLNENDQLNVYQALYIPYRYRYPLKVTIQKGDTLYKIAQKYNIQVEELLLVNNIRQNTDLKIGQILKVPAVETQVDTPVYNGPNYMKLFPNSFYLMGKTGEYKIALTFDDGPDSVYTPQILDILKKYNIKATFFLMGSRADKNPEIVKRIINEGHIIANHTWSHANLSNLSKQGINNEVSSTEKTIENMTGLKPSLVRPPYGDITVNVVKQLKKDNDKTIFWSVDSKDWSDRNVDQILINTLPNIRKDSIVLFHSAGGKGQSLAATVRTLPELITTLRMEGYEFVNLDQLLDVNPYK